MVNYTKSGFSTFHISLKKQFLVIDNTFSMRFIQVLNSKNALLATIRNFKLTLFFFQKPEKYRFFGVSLKSRLLRFLKKNKTNLKLYYGAKNAFFEFTTYMIYMKKVFFLVRNLFCMSYDMLKIVILVKILILDSVSQKLILTTKKHKNSRLMSSISFLGFFSRLLLRILH